jgi:pyrroloquinoline quinone (PQQ) biosynthesis protein C
MPDIIDPQPLTEAEFRDRLLAESAIMRAEDTRLYHLLKSGRCPPRLIRAYAAATVVSADLFCASLAEMVAKAPDAQSRLNLLENLLEEEGLSLAPESGLRNRPETAHPALARRFARAVGAEENPREARHASTAARALLARGEWVEAVAHLLLGQELRFADAAPAMAEALEAAGVARHDVAFFWVHKTADREHGEQALQIVLKAAKTRQQQDRCLAEARAGAMAWMDAHGGLAA